MQITPVLDLFTFLGVMITLSRVVFSSNSVMGKLDGSSMFTDDSVEAGRCVSFAVTTISDRL